MERNKRFFIVSFGNSREYIYEADASVDKLDTIEKEVKGFLEKEFPGQSLTYFETPEVKEIKESDLADYKDYPKLDAAALKEIEEVLKRGVEVRQDNQMLDSDAPYSDVK